MDKKPEQMSDEEFAEMIKYILKYEDSIQRDQNGDIRVGDDLIIKIIEPIED